MIAFGSLIHGSSKWKLERLPGQFKVNEGLMIIARSRDFARFGVERVDGENLKEETFRWPSGRRVSMTESSILAQNERWRRVLSMQVGRQPQRCGESGGRVSNAWTIDPLVGDSRSKGRIIPHETGGAKAPSGKAPAGAPRDESASHQLDGGVKAHRGDDG